MLSLQNIEDTTITKSYSGYPPIKQDALTKLDTVVTDQPTPRREPMLTFLNENSKLRLLEQKACCEQCSRYTSLCCRRKLKIADNKNNHLGFAAVSNRCCAFRRGILHDIFVPDKQLVLQTRSNFCCSCCLPCNCAIYCCSCCGDIRLVYITDDIDNIIGTFEYRPACCLVEMLPCCNKGMYILKNNKEETVMKIPNAPCCGTIWCRKGAACLDNKPCSRWAEPIQVVRCTDDSVAARIITEHEDPCGEYCCCAPMKYQIDYTAVENEEERALLLGSAVIMDHFMLNRSLLNEEPYEISHKVGAF